MNIWDLVKASEIASYYEDAYSDSVPYLGEFLFPRRKQAGLRLEQIKGYGGLPVELKASAFDTQTTYRDRIGIEITETDMPFFKEGFLLKEIDRQRLLELTTNSNKEYLKDHLQRIYDDRAKLIESSRVTEEIMRMQLLSSGRIRIENNGVLLDYDYGLPEENKAEVLASWGDAETSNPVLDFEKAKNAIARKGGVVELAIMNRKTFMKLTESKSIQNDIKDVKIITEEIAKNYMENKTKVKIVIYDKLYLDTKNVEKQFIVDDVVSFVPSNGLGFTVKGTTPEEADLMAGTEADVALVNMGTAITTSRTVDPVNIMTKVSMITLPSFERINHMFILDVNKE